MNIDLTVLARRGLEAELVRLDTERARIQALLSQLGGRSRLSTPTGSPAAPRTRTMSPEGRQRIQDAVRRRWERVRAEQAAAAGPGESDAATAAPAHDTQPDASGGRGTRKRRTTATRSGGRKK